jgi:hypothetical protein
MQDKLMQAIWDNAAKSGSLNIIMDLHSSNFPGCTTNTMDCAAMSGNVNIVHFLYNHTKQHCSTKAMDLACAYGYLKVVIFLNTYLIKYCDIDNSIKIAKLNGHHSIVSFLEKEKKIKIIN